MRSVAEQEVKKDIANMVVYQEPEDQDVVATLDEAAFAQGEQALRVRCGHSLHTTGICCIRVRLAALAEQSRSASAAACSARDCRAGPSSCLL